MTTFFVFGRKLNWKNILSGSLIELILYRKAKNHHYSLLYKIIKIATNLKQKNLFLFIFIYYKDLKLYWICYIPASIIEKFSLGCF